MYKLCLAVKHSLKFFFTASYGLPNFPELVVLAVVDDILAGYCDSNTRTVQPKQDWVIRLFKSDPQHLEWYTQECAEGLSNHFRGIMFNLRNRLNQTEGLCFITFQFFCFTVSTCLTMKQLIHQHYSLSLSQVSTFYRE